MKVIEHFIQDSYASKGKIKITAGSILTIKFDLAFVVRS